MKFKIVREEMYACASLQCIDVMKNYKTQYKIIKCISVSFLLKYSRIYRNTWKIIN